MACCMFDILIAPDKLQAIKDSVIKAGPDALNKFANDTAVCTIHLLVENMSGCKFKYASA